MNIPEITRLLTIQSGFDRRQVDELTVTAWHQVPEVAAAGYEDAVKVVIAHQTAPEAAEYFTVRHLVNGLKKSKRVADVEADVRSAKARGIIPENWPKSSPLNFRDAERLAELRERDRQEALRLAEIGS